MEDLLNLLQVNFTLFLAIIGITEFIKSTLPIQLKKFQCLIPVIISGFGVWLMITTKFEWRMFLYNWFLYFGTAIILYEVIVKTIKGKIDQMKNKEE